MDILCPVWLSLTLVEIVSGVFQALSKNGSLSVAPLYLKDMLIKHIILLISVKQTH